MTWAEHVEAIEAGREGFPIVQVCWVDAVSVAVEWEEEVCSDLRKTTTIGYLIDETDDALVLVSVINTEHVGHGIVIPKGCVTQQACLRVEVAWV